MTSGMIIVPASVMPNIQRVGLEASRIASAASESTRKAQYSVLGRDQDFDVCSAVDDAEMSAHCVGVTQPAPCGVSSSQNRPRTPEWSDSMGSITR